MTVPNILTIAGLDPSGGAGLLADVKTFSALGAYGCGAVTALTVQNTVGVTGISPVAASFVKEELDTLFDDVRIDAVKIGMIADAEIMRVVADRLEKYRPPYIVIDPVMVAKSGDALMAPEAVGVFREVMMPLATVLTPNIPEAAVLLGRMPWESAGRCEEEAFALQAMLKRGAWVLLKGGHLKGGESPDFLTNGRLLERFDAKRVATKNTHGTGCTLSSAVAALLPRTKDVPSAVRGAKDYIENAIAHADELEVGRGHGPVHHFEALWRGMTFA